MKSLADIRSNFLEFFHRHGHEVIASSPLVPRNDPSLLFTNAGMVQFKNVFTGQETRAYSRAASVQKCLRAGGKHNDLDNVGYTARHHTFFEMLGNFSFGDYFKDDAIALAWQLLTREFAIPAEKLTVTVFAEDEDAAQIWKKVAGFSDSRIIRIATSDNFWSMGDSGPCGPCSEIFYDHGDHIAGGPPGSPDADGDRFVEIWNLVFMQFDQQPGAERLRLPRPSIDTGMGLERIAAVLQGVHDNYDTDLFRHLIQASAELSGQGATGAHAASHRVISDHLRSTSFLIADGVLPSNEGRGYVLRRIMRRAMRHAHLLGAKEPLLYRLVPVLLAEMGQAYPELKRAEALISETLRIEELRFRETLARGLKLLDEASEQLSSGEELAGETAFKLYDTYGFPLDLTEDALRVRGIGVDRAGFEAAMQRQRTEARRAWAGSGEASDDRIWFELREEFGASEFLGYDSDMAEGTILAMIHDGHRVDAAKAGDTVRILINQTPFYAESGGQVGDEGAMFSAKGAEAEIRDTEKKLGALHVHVAVVSRGEFKIGDAVELRIDAERRRATRANHSATHLLHAALKRVLGPHVAQKGSMVGPDRLRFDFSHPKALSGVELERVESQVNAVIRQNGDVSTRLMPTEEAISAGAEALFGEKYGNEVRVLSMGEDNGGPMPYSVELCGGTHVRRLGDIGLFTILAETAVASGVRRIEAMTSEAARLYLTARADLAREAAAVLKTAPGELPVRLQQLSEERRRLERELVEARRALALAGPGDAGAAAEGQETIGNVAFLYRPLRDFPTKDLKAVADEAKAKLGSGIVVIANTVEGKVSLVVGVSADLSARFSAGELVRIGSEPLGGRGGGRADMAQGGGPEVDKLEAAVEAIRAAIVARAQSWRG